MAQLTNSPAPTALRRALLLDAAASGGMGILLLITAGALADLLGLPPNLLRWCGIVLVPFAAVLVWVARRGAVSPGLVGTIIAGNGLWVVASLLLLLSGSVAPTMLGELFVLAQAGAVLLLTFLEYRGARRDRAVRHGGRAAAGDASPGA